jgi:hypothetical protein
MYIRYVIPDVAKRAAPPAKTGKPPPAFLTLKFLT